MLVKACSNNVRQTFQLKERKKRNAVDSGTITVLMNPKVFYAEEAALQNIASGKYKPIPTRPRQY
jgi:hypothetical protein